ncbi:CpaD family pilus assembly protein [Nitratireductor basaltis]|uniref:Pilus (Caulobacter type) biogenesis lipoprotein CpaD n=1 Tax=Nitratireductor basaltis TaxID=472175 RepID=A0A084U612_9HYPH|nr:CpaD family pilus assembly lipoprotein [Nitratireductor basaltis]KFB08398.1 Pilus (Caulobacter type) biogenesis lipoprotein CpaD precursor [Nitratireductor basaltis]
MIVLGEMKRGMPILAVVLASLLAGCAAKRDSVIVGSVPEDYRTRHPIVIAEGVEVLDLPVASTSNRMTYQQKAAISGFLSNYAESGGSVVSILVPAGAANSAAALDVARDFRDYIARRGVHAGQIQLLNYQAQPDRAAPIRLSYSRVKAQVGQCGRWPSDLLKTEENRNWENFGCSYQNNLAAQVANPMDFLGPREMTPIDAENRDAAITDYKDRLVSDDFRSRSEVDYD